EPAATLPDLHGRGLLDLDVERRVARSLEADLDVVAGLLALDLAPSVVQQVLQPAGRGLPELVRARNLDLQAFVSNFLAISHKGPRVAGGGGGHRGPPTS